MPNPVTAALLKNITDPELREFVELWDDLEYLIIQAYRTQGVDSEDEHEFSEVHKELCARYPRWKDELAKYWRQSRIKDQDELDDPFAYLLDRASAADFIGNWEAMKRLPAAREALNNYLLSCIEDPRA